MSITIVLIYLGIGLFAGFMSGMFGIGGGAIRIPLLNFAGLPLITAFGINLFVIPFSSSIGAITHRRNIDTKVAVYVIIGGALGSITGAFLVGIISGFILAVLFVITAIITVSAIYLDRIAPELSKRIHPNKSNFVWGAFFLNLITGMRGGSGGSLFPSFLKAMKLNIRKAIATSLFVTIFTAFLAMIVYWERGNIIWLPALCVLIGSMIGARAGGKISLKTRPAWLKIGLSLLVIILALGVLYKAII